MADLWPLQSFLELAPLASAVPRARRHVRQLLREWNRTDSGESAELVVSELLTNAVQATGMAEVFAPVRLWLLSDKRSLPPQRFLVDQFLENDHLQCAAADPRRQLWRNVAIVLLGIRKHREHLSLQIAVGKHRPIHSRYRLAGGLAGFFLRSGELSGGVGGNLGECYGDCKQNHCADG